MIDHEKGAEANNHILSRVVLRFLWQKIIIFENIKNQYKFNWLSAYVPGKVSQYILLTDIADNADIFTAFLRKSVGSARNFV